MSWARAFGEDYSLRLPADNMRAIGASLRIRGRRWRTITRPCATYPTNGTTRRGKGVGSQPNRAGQPSSVRADGPDMCGKMLRVDVADLEQRVVCAGVKPSGPARGC